MSFKYFLFNKTLIILMIASISFGLVSCGFQPVYKNPGLNKNDNSSTLSSNLKKISIKFIEGRLGYKLQESLSESLGLRFNNSSSQYLISISTETSKSALLIQDDDKVSRYNLYLRASFVLNDVDKTSEIYRGNARSVASFNVVDSQFATIIAEQDAENRAVREVSAQIHSLLISYFSRKQKKN